MYSRETITTQSKRQSSQTYEHTGKILPGGILTDNTKTTMLNKVQELSMLNFCADNS